MDQLFNLGGVSPLSINSLIINLLLSIVLAGIVAQFYTRYGLSFSNRARFAQNLPALTLTTVLIISVVKSSLALSLGLVGALSIVRFRTAIKEPEELVYLFLSISIGLGMGADQRLPTIVAVVIIIIFLYARTLLNPQIQKNNLFFNILSPDRTLSLQSINEILLKHTQVADLRRVDNAPESLQATYLVKLAHDEALVQLMDDLRTNIPQAEFSFVEQDNALAG